MALLPDLETFKCSPALILKCLADVSMNVTFTSREQINLCFLSELFSSYFVFFVFSFNESFNAVNIYV